MSVNDAFIKNEQVKMQLKMQQDVNRLQIKELMAQVEDLTEALARKKAAYKALKKDIKRLDE